MDTLNLHYDREVDYLYGHYGDHRESIGVRVPRSAVTLMVDPARVPRGFDIDEFRRLSPHRVPLVEGRLPLGPLKVPAGTAWLVFDFSGRDLVVSLEHDPEIRVRAPDFSFSATHPHGLDLDISSLFAADRRH